MQRAHQADLPSTLASPVSVLSELCTYAYKFLGPTSLASGVGDFDFGGSLTCFDQDGNRAIQLFSKIASSDFSHCTAHHSP